MIECCRADAKLVKVADLAASLDLSMQNVFKIVHILSRAGLVAGARGRYGGIRLARSAEDIRLGDIVRAMEQTNLADDDRLPLDAERAQGADVNVALASALEAFIDVLDRHTLAAMAGGMVGAPLAGGSREATAKGPRSRKERAQPPTAVDARR